jgi:pyridoxine 5-phosphate synthase
VPENRAEITTEGGLDVAGDIERVADGVRRLAGAGIRVALFIAPDLAQVEAARRSGAPVIELHTGSYAEASGAAQARELERLATAARRAGTLGLEVHAGHGLTYNNVAPVAAIPEIVELNIGHCIIARAIFTGLDAAVRDMKALMIGARR